MGNKIEICENMSKIHRGNRVYRIRYNKDFIDSLVGKQDKKYTDILYKSKGYGGYVELKAEFGANIMDNSLILDDAYVGCNSTVGTDSVICDMAEVFGNSHVGGNTIVNGKSIVCNSTMTYGNIRIVGNSTIDGGDSNVRDNFGGNISILNYLTDESLIHISNSKIEASEADGAVAIKGNIDIADSKISNRKYSGNIMITTMDRANSDRGKIDIANDSLIGGSVGIVTLSGFIGIDECEIIGKREIEVGRDYSIRISTEKEIHLSNSKITNNVEIRSHGIIDIHKSKLASGNAVYEVLKIVGDSISIGNGANIEAKGGYLYIEGGARIAGATIKGAGYILGSAYINSDNDVLVWKFRDGLNVIVYKTYDGNVVGTLDCESEIGLADILNWLYSKYMDEDLGELDRYLDALKAKGLHCKR